MRNVKFIFAAAAGMMACCFELSACDRAPIGVQDPIVGAWFVRAPSAPFPYHMFQFSADGTMQQANPDAGDSNTSDSDGMGVWLKKRDRIVGKFAEVTADRATHAFVSRGEVAFDVKVDGDVFKGTASARFYDDHGILVGGPLVTSLEGQRVLLDITRSIGK